MVEDKCLVVAQIAYRIFPIVWVLKRAHLQVGKSVQIQHFLEVAHFISRYVEVFQRHQAVQRHAYDFDLVPSHI